MKSKQKLLMVAIMAIFSATFSNIYGQSSNALNSRMHYGSSDGLVPAQPALVL